MFHIKVTSYKNCEKDCLNQRIIKRPERLPIVTDERVKKEAAFGLFVSKYTKLLEQSTHHQN